MDIIEGLLSLGSYVVDSMISTSARYSKDERFTPEGRKYYKELHEDLTLAKDNLEEYKNKKNSSTFEKLRSNATSNSKLDAKRSSTDAFKARTLIEVYFGKYRGRRPFYFFDEQHTDEHKEILDWLRDFKGSRNLNFTPIFALTDYASCPSSGSLIFYEEGLGFFLDHDSEEFVVMPYAGIEVINRWTEKVLFFSTDYKIDFSDLSDKISTFIVTFTASRNDLESKELDLITGSTIYDFIKCFNSNCKFVNHK